MLTDNLPTSLTSECEDGQEMLYSQGKEWLLDSSITKVNSLHVV